MPAEGAAGELMMGYLLVGARAGAVAAFVPLPGIRGVLQPARALLVVGLTLALAPAVAAAPPAPPTPALLAGWLLAEAALGSALGLAVAMLTEGLLVAAQVMGLQVGYSYATTIDPNSEADSSVLQLAAHLAAGLLFFAFSPDQVVLRALARSFERLPPGVFALNGEWAARLLDLGAAMWAAGLRLALPVAALLMLVDIALALTGRLNAHLQLLSLAFPAKMLAALATLALLARLFPAVFRRAAEGTAAALEALAG